MSVANAIIIGRAAPDSERVLPYTAEAVRAFFLYHQRRFQP
jgi:hypothetical protein